MMKLVLIILVILAIPLVLVMAVGSMLPKGHSISRAITVNAPPDAVWNLITAPPTWRQNITKSQEMESQNGHRMWRETDKGGQTITYEAVESDPPRRLVTRIADPSLPFGGTWTYEITPSGAAERLLPLPKMERSTIRPFDLFPDSSWATQPRLTLI